MGVFELRLREKHGVPRTVGNQGVPAPGHGFSSQKAPFPGQHPSRQTSPRFRASLPRKSVTDGIVVLNPILGSRRWFCHLLSTWICGQRELKNCTPGSVCARPQSSLMSLNNRTTDRQSHPQATGLGRVEGLEQPVGALRGYPGTRVVYRHAHTIQFALAGADQQFARPFAHGAHRLDSVDHQVEITC